VDANRQQDASNVSYQINGFQAVIDHS
jgi:hypothetical protein